jgi:hypothetical protein
VAVFSFFTGATLDIFKDFYADAKKHKGIVYVFLFIGVIVGTALQVLILSKWTLDYIDLLRGDFVLTSKIEQSYVPLGEYRKAAQSLKELQAANSVLANKVASLQENIGILNVRASSAICQRYDRDLQNLSTELNLTEGAISEALSLDSGIAWNRRRKSDEERQADMYKAQQLRVRADGINMQISQIRKEMWKCAG